MSSDDVHQQLVSRRPHHCVEQTDESSQNSTASQITGAAAAEHYVAVLGWVQYACNHRCQRGMRPF
jgi:hypothetical protein